MIKQPAIADVRATRIRLDLALILFATLLGTYAYFWQSRDWNAATRLMLTYALVDRHQVEIDGLEEQAGHRERNVWSPRFGEIVDGDLARVGRHFYTDKAPGQSFLGLPLYAIAKVMGGLPSHPLDELAFAYWPADYFVTLGTSGVLTAGLALVIYAFAVRLGATHFGGAMLGLAYGLGTPAFVYACLFYGHQAAAFCTAISFFLLYRAAHEGRARFWNVLVAGLLAGYSVVVEYQTAGIVAALGLYALPAVRRVRLLFTFLIAAGFAASLLAAYNYRAFGDPLDMGYVHEVSPEFRAVHSGDNPLGLRWPAPEIAWQTVLSILWGRYRGLTFYAPILLAAPVGLLVLFGRRFWGVGVVSFAAIAWMLTVNVTYPLWEGGWCTGPRFLTPAIPFAMFLVAGLLGIDRSGFLSALLALATLASSVLMLSCVAVGGRFPPVLDDPVLQVVLPHWLGELPEGLEAIAAGRQFEWNVGRWLLERFAPTDVLPAEPSPWQSLQMAPLVAYWLVMLVLLVFRARSRTED